VLLCFLKRLKLRVALNLASVWLDPIKRAARCMPNGGPRGLSRGWAIVSWDIIHNLSVPPFLHPKHTHTHTHTHPTITTTSTTCITFDEQSFHAH
jgi:hypothetical protein